MRHYLTEGHRTLCRGLHWDLVPHTRTVHKVTCPDCAMKFFTIMQEQQMKILPVEPFFTPNRDLPDLLPRTEVEAELYLGMIRETFEKFKESSKLQRDEEGLLPFLPNIEFPVSMLPRLKEFGFRLPHGHRI